MGCSAGVGYGGQAAIVRTVDEVAIVSVTSGVAARLEVFDPGFVRTRRGVRAVWAAAALLVLLMFSSYALRAWSPRVASLALMGAITVYVTGGGHITIGRIGWFVLAAAIGFGWLAVWEPVRGFHEVSSVTNSSTMTRIRAVSQRGQYQQSNSAR